MRKLTNDRNGMGALAVTGIIVVIGLAIIIIPMVIGWAVAYLIHLVTGEPEITEYWARWVIGIAVIVVASVFKPDNYYMINRRFRSGGNRDYWFNDEE